MTATDSAQPVPPPDPSASPPDPSASPPDPSDQLELKLPGEATSWRDLSLWAGVLVLLALVCYWPAVGGRFQWLDNTAVSENRALALPGGLSYVWTARWGDRADTYPFRPYQPVAFTADWIAYRLGGHDENGVPTPPAYHIVSLACHALAAVLVWLTLRELAVPAAWLIAAVFAVHPANAEAVSWLHDGGVPVAGLLFWGSIYSYLWYQTFRARDAADQAGGGPGGDPAQTWGLYAASVACAVLATLSWPAAGGAAGVLMLGLWWRNRLTTLDVLLLLPVQAVGAILWLTNLSLSRPNVAAGASPVAGLTPTRIVALTGESVAFVVGKFLVPVRLSLLYPSTLAGGLVALAIAAAALTVAIVVARRGGPRGPAAGLLAVALCAVPALNWVDPARRSQQVDPLVYLAAVPLAALTLAAVMAGVRRVRPAGVAHVQGVVAASALVLLVLGTLAWRRADLFADPVRLWQDSADRQPAMAFPRSMYAEQLRLRAVDEASPAVGDTDAAKADLQATIEQAGRAVELAGGDAVAAAAAQRTWAAALVNQGQFQQALPHYAQATRPDAGPADARTLVDYGQALFSLGNLPQAQAELNLAIAADYSYGAAHRVLGQVYAKMGNVRRGDVEYGLALQYTPGDLTARQLLAESLADQGRLAESWQQYIAVITDPSNRMRPDLWLAVAKLKLRQDEPDKAVEAFSTAKKLDPKLDVDAAGLPAARALLKKESATRPAMTQPAIQPAPDAAMPPG